MSVQFSAKILNHLFITFFSLLIAGSASIMVYSQFFVDNGIKLSFLYGIILVIGVAGIIRMRKN